MWRIYNFCCVDETLRTTPPMALGLIDHVWSIGELIDAYGRATEDRNQLHRIGGGNFR